MIVIGDKLTSSSRCSRVPFTNEIGKLLVQIFWVLDIYVMCRSERALLQPLPFIGYIPPDATKYLWPLTPSGVQNGMISYSCHVICEDSSLHVMWYILC